MSLAAGGPHDGGMRIARAGFVYFACVFAVGFVLGSVRVPLLVPRLGERTAELVELPVMVLASAVLARWRQRRTADLTVREQRLVGAVAVASLLVAECGLGALLGRTPWQVLFDRDPIAGPAYYLALAAFAGWPWFWARRAERRRNAVPQE